MRTRWSYLIFMAMGIGLLHSCQKETGEVEIQNNLLKCVIVSDSDFEIIKEEVPIVTNDCAEVKSFPFQDAANLDIYSDDDYIYLRVLAQGEWKIQYMSVFIGDVEDIPLKSSQFPYYTIISGMNYASPFVLFKIPIDPNWQECVTIAVKLVAQIFNEAGEVVQAYGLWVTTDNVVHSGNYYIDYCFKECEECVPEGYRTQTQGGWGSAAQGENPGVYRDAHFDEVFPDGLVVGGNYTLTLNSAIAVQNFLPSGGTPAMLNANFINPSGSDLNNAFAGNLVALTLSVNFDKNDADFGIAKSLLKDLVFKSGNPFEGLSVEEVLTDANLVFGGGVSIYGFSASDLNDAVDQVNNSFVDGITSSNNVLVCP